MSAPSSKRQKTHPTYELLYHPSIPGRAEYIRLAFEVAGVAYHEPAKDGSEDGKGRVYGLLGADADEDGNPPIYAPPALRIPGGGLDGKSLLISQTPNILLYLGEHLGLLPEGNEGAKYWVNELALTALDLCNEAHDTHHPVGMGLYYEDQKEESLKRSKEFREARIPKYLGYFERVLKGNEPAGKGKYLVGNTLTYADTTLWQSLDGLLFAFPNELKAIQKDYRTVFETFYTGIKEEENIKQYLGSQRRLPYSQGIFRKYPELDRQE